MGTKLVAQQQATARVEHGSIRAQVEPLPAIERTRLYLAEPGNEGEGILLSFVALDRQLACREPPTASIVDRETERVGCGARIDRPRLSGLWAFSCTQNTHQSVRKR